MAPSRNRHWQPSTLPLLLISCGQLLVSIVVAYERPPRFLLISSPNTQNVYYAQLPSLHDLTLPRTERPVTEAQVLIDGEGSKCSGWGCSEDSNKGLRKPYGLALHQGCDSATLYVSDIEAKCIYAYELSTSTFGGVQVGSQRRVRMDIEASFLAVDGHGNLYYTAPEAGKIGMISYESRFNTTAAPVKLYSNPPERESAPAGLASDGFQLYWADKQGDENSGAVVSQRVTHDSIGPRSITSSGVVSRGMAVNVCLARDNVFFTGEGNSLLAVKTGGSAITEVAPRLAKPRGCAYDGEATLYVADDGVAQGPDGPDAAEPEPALAPEPQSAPSLAQRWGLLPNISETIGPAGFIYSLPANLGSLRAVRHLTKVVAVEGPNQLAIFAALPSSNRDCSFQPAGRGSIQLQQSGTAIVRALGSSLGAAIVALAWTLSEVGV